MNNIALKDKEQYPSESVLSLVMQQYFHIYKKFIQQINEKEIDISWRYYNDGKAWLGKLLWKKKNLGWLHVYNNDFKVSVYFTEKYRQGVLELDIPNEIKDTFQKTTNSGKLIPLTLTIKLEQDIVNILNIIDYKKRCR